MSNTIAVPCATPWHRPLWPFHFGGMIAFQSACECTNSVLPLLKPRTVSLLKPHPVWWSTLSTVHATWRWGVARRVGRRHVTCRGRGRRGRPTRPRALRGTTVRRGRYRHRRQSVTGPGDTGGGDAEKE